MIGSKLAHYEITGHLGTGGMGEVYAASDSRLGRRVAIKCLPVEFADDADRLGRFHREARVLASLNHSSIAAIYGFDEAAGRHFLVMELVDGETIEDLIRRGPIPWEDAIKLARQITDALEAAHDKGILHRDLKPANIKVTSDGKVKVLDFGLAKILETEFQGADLSNSPTMMSRASTPGVILGTAAYMSPEQSRGRPVDRRTDVWAFGIVLFEMLTGRHAFDGQTVTDVLGAIAHKDLPWDLLPPETPEPIRRLLRRCCAKDPASRLRDIADARLELDAALTEPAAPTQQSSVARRSGVAWVAASVVVVAAFVIGQWTRGTGVTADEKPVWTELLPPERAFGNRPLGLALSPDGRSLAFTAPDASGETVLWIRSFESGRARALPQTRGAALICWAPDGRSLGFVADGKLKRIELAGGIPLVLADAPFAEGVAWSADGTILFIPTATNVQRISAAGGTPVDVTHLDASRTDVLHGFPSFLPDQKHFLVWVLTSDKKNEGVYAVSPTGTMKMILPFRTRAVYANGFLFFGRPPFLMAQRFDPTTLELSGDAVRVAEGLGWDNVELSNMQFSVSDSGTVVWSNHSPIGRAQPTWLDRTGRVIGTTGEPGPYIGLTPSPNGKQVATEVVDISTMTTDIVLLDGTGGNPERLTVANYWAGNPVWSSDSRRVLFTQWLDRFFVMPMEGGESAQMPFAGGSNADFPQSWSEDGRHLLVVRADRSNQRDLWSLPLTGDRTPRPYLNSPLDEADGRFSPDGQWVAYTSNESGRTEVFVQSFPVPGNKRRVSANGGVKPMWRSDGKELYFVNNDTMMAASVTVVSNSLAFAPAVLFKSNFMIDFGDNRPAFAPDPEGKRFLVLLPVATDRPERINVIHHWKR